MQNMQRKRKTLWDNFPTVTMARTRYGKAVSALSKVNPVPTRKTPAPVPPVTTLRSVPCEACSLVDLQAYIWASTPHAKLHMECLSTSRLAPDWFAQRTGVPSIPHLGYVPCVSFSPSRPRDVQCKAQGTRIGEAAQARTRPTCFMPFLEARTREYLLGMWIWVCITLTKVEQLGGARQTL